MEQLKHECGVALVRLLKPQSYYEQKYGTQSYALNKLYLMMEKQHNRGQEGAGIACVDMNAPVGSEYMFREKALGKDAITDIFDLVTPEWTSAQLFMGHLRYSTTGKSGLQYVHPFLRRNNWRAKNLCLCGNFNMTNIEEIFEKIVKQGQSPRIYSDSYITLELMGHRLDREVERLFVEAKQKGLEGTDITHYIEDNVQMANVLRTTMTDYDGGYVMCGMTGSGEMFAMRDPWGCDVRHDGQRRDVCHARPLGHPTSLLASGRRGDCRGQRACCIANNLRPRLRRGSGVAGRQGTHCTQGRQLCCGNHLGGKATKPLFL